MENTTITREELDRAIVEIRHSHARFFPEKFRANREFCSGRCRSAGEPLG